MFTSPGFLIGEMRAGAGILIILALAIGVLVGMLLADQVSGWLQERRFR
jgi:hypothetical protein